MLSLQVLRMFQLRGCDTDGGVWRCRRVCAVLDKVLLKMNIFMELLMKRVGRAIS